MAWCDVVDLCTLRECRIALGKSQAGVRGHARCRPPSRIGPGMLDGGRRRRRCSHERGRWRRIATTTSFCPLPVLALLIGVHVKTLRAAARDGRLPVTHDTRTTFRRLRARATPAAARDVSAVVLWANGPPSRSSRAIDLGQRSRRLRRADSRGSSRARVEPGAIGHAGGRGAQSCRLPMGGAETHAVTAVLATNRRALRASGQPLGAPFARPNGSGKPSTMRTVSTLTWTIRRIVAIRSRGSSNHPLGSLTMPLSLSWVIL